MKDSRYRVVFENGKTVDLKPGSLGDLNILELSGSDVSFLSDGKMVKAKILSFDPIDKLFKIRLSGQTFPLKLMDDLDLRIEQMGLNDSTDNGMSAVHAPMPGLVLDIHISPGQSVSKGENLLTLEAMKMENIIKSPGAGTIKEVNTSKGDTVDKGQLLISFE